jgi:SAM-dependent methyltransferase
MSKYNQQDAIWEYFQNEAPEKFEGSLSRISYLVKPQQPGQKVLNIGVGAGLFEALALKAGIDVYALDPVPKSIEALQKKFSMSDKAKVGYSEEIPFPDAMFDCVVASEVLEHLTDESIAATLPEIRRVLISGGVFKGTVPARENLTDQMVVCPGCTTRFHRWGHQQSFTVERVRNLLEEHFSVKVVTEKLFIPFNTMNYKGRMAGALKLLSFKLGQHGSDENIYFEALKKS